MARSVNIDSLLAAEARHEAKRQRTVVRENQIRPNVSHDVDPMASNHMKIDDADRENDNGKRKRVTLSSRPRKKAARYIEHKGLKLLVPDSDDDSDLGSHNECGWDESMLQPSDDPYIYSKSLSQPATAEYAPNVLEHATFLSTWPELNPIPQRIQAPETISSFFSDAIFAVSLNNSEDECAEKAKERLAYDPLWASRSLQGSLAIDPRYDFLVNTFDPSGADNRKKAAIEKERRAKAERERNSRPTGLDGTLSKRGKVEGGYETATKRASSGAAPIIKALNPRLLRKETSKARALDKA